MVAVRHRQTDGALRSRKGVRNRNHGRSRDRIDGWVGPSPPAEISSEPGSAMKTSFSIRAKWRSCTSPDRRVPAQGLDTADTFIDAPLPNHGNAEYESYFPQGGGTFETMACKN